MAFYSDYVIEMMLIIHMLLKLPLRQTDEFIRSIFELVRVKLEVHEFEPDYPSELNVCLRE
ncbi:hypothetical protein NF27_CK00030 [Candidatus Jidaibacter acanthamoeba]|uniref:Transposase DDE domain-containing protein n=1 Tax=Candidatus Jidaibacter acanthamoebae TaxID=86105 RepID=A0A0C1R0G6_9RICK|nr:transposase [Candidatus Jidaibacter acanthamoeba]KIE05810.1 hypothetical protein NF27_CK00030 [Candidatus Jidaibacter acanthamoeba]